MVPSCPAPAELLRRSTLEFPSFPRGADRQGISPGPGRLTCALLASLLIHALLLSLTFGGGGFWLPGLGFPWQDRRIEAPDLRVVVVPAQVTAPEPGVAPVADSLQASVERPVAKGLALTPSVTRAPTPTVTATAIVPEASPRAQANPGTEAASGESPAQEPLPAARPDDAVPPPIPFPPVIAVAQTDEPTWSVPATPAMPTPVIVAVPAPGPETAMPSPRDAGDAARSDQEAAVRAVEAQPQAEKLEAVRQDAARVEAARVEAARVEAARVEAARVEAARVEAARVEAARQRRSRPHESRLHGSRLHGSRLHESKSHESRLHESRLHESRQHGSRQHGSRQRGSRQRGSRPHEWTLRKRRPQDGKRPFGR